MYLKIFTGIEWKKSVDFLVVLNDTLTNIPKLILISFINLHFFLFCFQSAQKAVSSFFRQQRSIANEREIEANNDHEGQSSSGLNRQAIGQRKGRARGGQTSSQRIKSTFKSSAISSRHTGNNSQIDRPICITRPMCSYQTLNTHNIITDGYDNDKIPELTFSNTNFMRFDY